SCWVDGVNIEGIRHATHRIREEWGCGARGGAGALRGDQGPRRADRDGGASRQALPGLAQSRGQGPGIAARHGRESRPLPARAVETMMAYFADTFYFLALLDPDDAAHERATNVAARLPGRLVTTA